MTEDKIKQMKKEYLRDRYNEDKLRDLIKASIGDDLYDKYGDDIVKQCNQWQKEDAKYCMDHYRGQIMDIDFRKMVPKEAYGDDEEEDSPDDDKKDDDKHDDDDDKQHNIDKHEEGNSYMLIITLLVIIATAFIVFRIINGNHITVTKNYDNMIF